MEPIASALLRRRLSTDGQVLRARVRSFPALALLWRRIDRIELAMREYTLDMRAAPELTNQTLSVDRVDARIERLRVGSLTLHDVSFDKSGPRLRARGRVDTAALQRALPVIQSIEAVESVDGRLTFKGTAELLGVRASVTATLAAIDGRLVVMPSGLLGAFARVTVFDDRLIAVESVSGHAVADGGGLVITLTGRTR